MDKSEISTLHAKISLHDYRFIVDEYKIMAWHEVLDPNMTLDDGLECVTRHYASSTEMIMPAHVNKIWKEIKSKSQESRNMEYVKRMLVELEEQKSLPPQDFTLLIENSTGVKTDIANKILSIPCPFCGAKIAEGCKETVSGRRLQNRFAHPSREEKAGYEYVVGKKEWVTTFSS